ncbi:MAG: universal stress protein [Thermodesulfobacteriota bacterium]|nr:universal stress protein [Thermodesulfobacteriota bacterium]
MKKAREMLLQAGLAETQVATKVVDGSRSAANDIVKEAKKRRFGTIVLGRRGESGSKEFLMGCVAGKVLEAADDMTVMIVQ